MPGEPGFGEENCTDASKTGRLRSARRGVPQRHLGVGRNRLARRIRAYTDTAPRPAESGRGRFVLSAVRAQGLSLRCFARRAADESCGLGSRPTPRLSKPRRAARVRTQSLMSVTRSAKQFRVQARRIRTTPSAIAQAHLESGSCLGRVSRCTHRREPFASVRLATPTQTASLHTK